jgi:magnesium-transporting ATPase (P-type)
MSLALAFEPPAAALMQQPPRPPQQPLLTPELIRRVVVVSLFNWAIIFGLFLWAETTTGDLALARTMAVQGLVLAHLVYLLSISHWQQRLHKLHRLGWRAISDAPAVPLGLLATLMVQALFSQSAWMNTFFGTHPLNLMQLIICLMPSVLMLPVAHLAHRVDPEIQRG